MPENRYLHICIDTLRIKNFKGIAELELKFPEQFTVLIGDNGTGKTAILDALAVAAGSYLLGIERAYAQPRQIYPEDVRRIAVSSVERAVEQFPVIIDAEGNVGGRQIHWKRERLSLSARTTSKDTHVISKIAAKDQSSVRSLGENSDIILPVLAYQSTTRLWNEGKVEFKRQNNRLEGYLDCMSSKSSGKLFQSWFKTFDSEARSFNQPLVEEMLQTFKQTIMDVVSEWTNISYSPADDDIVGFYKQPDGNQILLPFRMLSDGYRNAVGIVADIAYRCLKLNPYLRDKAIKLTPGIVLIDEIDLHLHPKWQKRIVNDLKKVFPKIQFIATTHSPFIVQSLRHEELINLEPEKDQNDTDPFRLSIEDISEREMNIKNPRRSDLFEKMEDKAAVYFNYVSQGQTSRNNEEVAKIKKELDSIETEFSKDPAYVALIKAKRSRL